MDHVVFLTIVLAEHSKRVLDVGLFYSRVGFERKQFHELVISDFSFTLFLSTIPTINFSLQQLVWVEVDHLEYLFEIFLRDFRLLGLWVSSHDVKNFPEVGKLRLLRD